MGTSGRPSINKRSREQARKERTQRKELQRDQRAAAQQLRVAAAPGEDPDIAHIVPGPQRPIE